MSKGESKKIRLISFVLTIEVVLRHSINYELYGLSGVDLFVERYLQELTDMAVPSFFIISGFLFFRTFDYSIWGRKIASRVRSLLLPYFIWNMITYLYYVIISYIPFVQKAMNQGAVKWSFSSLFSEILFGGRNGTWYIRYLMLFILVFSALFFVLRKWWGTLTILLICFVLGMAIKSQLLVYSMFFVFGAALGISDKKGRNIDITVKHPRILFFVLLFLTFISMIVLDMDVLNPLYAPLRIIEFVVMWFAFDGIMDEKEVPWWMFPTIFIYLSHRMILESVEKIFWFIFGASTGAAFVDLIFAPIITLLIIWLLASITRKVPVLWKILTGGRGV